MHRRTRWNYWSHSSLSKRIRKKFGLGNPVALTFEGWDEHHQESKQKAPFIHWLTDEGFNKLQDVAMFIPDVWWNIRTATIWSFFRNIWLFRKCLWNYKAFDYSGMLRFMEESAKDMSRYSSENGHLVRSDETAKELKVFAELVKRIRENEYDLSHVDYIEPENGRWLGGSFKNKPNTLPIYGSKGYNKIKQACRKDDLKLASKMFERKLLSWWD